MGRSTWRAPLGATAIALTAALLSPRLAAAQRKGPEFTRQGLLVTNFSVAKGVDSRLGRRAGDGVRSRVGKYVVKRDVDVIDGYDIREKLERAGYKVDTAFLESDIRSLGDALRADEYVVGVVEQDKGAIRLSATLVLMRDRRLRQPLPTVTAPRLDEATEALARSLGAARQQLIPQRRCENALRDGKGSAATQHARDGIALYPRSTLARTCLVWALRAMARPSTEVLAVANEVLDVDSMSAHSLEAAAVALDTLHRRDEAAKLWLRLAATDSADLELTERVLYALVHGGNARHAQELAVRASDAHPGHLPLLRQKWRVSYENRAWTVAIAAGEALLARDETAIADPVFFQRLATAYRANGQPYKSVEIAARGVAVFPKEARLYALYTQFVKEEADTVLPRGLALFPRSAELLALNAKELRTRGKVSESLDAMRLAMQNDSTIPDGALLIAQSQIELGRADSALVGLRTALARGEDSSRVAQFIFARGNALYRAANGTKTSADFGLALRFLAFADTLRPSAQSHFLAGAAALGVAQTALTEAPAAGADRARGCELARLGAAMIPYARAGIEAGQEIMPDAVKQSLDYLGQIEPYAGKQIEAFCASAPGAPGAARAAGAAGAAGAATSGAAVSGSPAVGTHDRPRPPGDAHR